MDSATTLFRVRAMAQEVLIVGKTVDTIAAKSSLVAPTRQTDRILLTKSCPHVCSYVILDAETTGLSPQMDEIIQLSAIRYDCFGTPISFYDTYLNPGIPIPADATAINGITDEDVSGAPAAKEIKEDFLSFLGNSLIVGYNVNFDLRFLNETFTGAFLDWKYVDALLMTRKAFTAPDYKLETIASMLNFSPEGGFHDSFADCDAVAAVLNSIEGQAPLCEHIRHFRAARARSPRAASTTSAAKAYLKSLENKPQITFDEIICSASHPLCGRTVVFTGEMSFSRKSAAIAAERAGATVKNNVSKKVDYLIVGKQDISLVGDDGMSTKEEKAHALNDSGVAAIKLISEDDFLELLSWDGGNVCG